MSDRHSEPKVSPGNTIDRLSRYFPFLSWLFHYRSQDLAGDLTAGAIAAVMLVPQSMAYALLAGLPVQVGLYASILPLVLYALLGTSRVLSVGPVAIVSLLVAAGVGQLATPNTPTYLLLAMTLAFVVGLLQIGMGLVRLGFVANFLSHAVISGFISASALIIGLGQLKHLLGIQLPSAESFAGMLAAIAQQIHAANSVTLGIGLGSMLLLIYFQQFLGNFLKQRQIASHWIVPIVRSGPLLVVVGSTLLVWLLRLDRFAQVKIVGAIPTGLPPISMPQFDWATWQALLPTAAIVSLVGFVESIAVAKSLASKRRQKIDADRELIGLGAANLGAAFTGGFPVTGGFSRSVVNFAAGANTGLASIVTAVLIAATLIFLTPLFYFLPQTTLAATIIVAVFGLLDVATFKRMWVYDKTDAISLLVTFFAVLGLGVEIGIIVGVVASLLLYLWRTSRPHIAVVGRVGDTEHFRNVLRHAVKTYPHVIAVRVDGSLYFANTKYLEDFLLRAIADRPDIQHLVLICSAIDFIDASALETLENLREDLEAAGIHLYLSEVKGPVMDRLQEIGFVQRLGSDRIFLTTHQAMLALGCC
ncbi:SulP family inorganic anion transporter [Pseudanabaena sp. PCC 6802]|uniref:SulP family inorganic anion transporter n=1 Tax=Pseudanabaena sp. PCC 6802 TaxID=118173 RepID=UPI000344DC11|nr:solute carrier family 26 protein [Pseudanabaena sp. PCC 6802]